MFEGGIGAIGGSTGNTGGGENETTPTPEPTPTPESYVGYYADIDGDKIVDGIIYADLAVGNTSEDGIWNNDDTSNSTYNDMGTYTIPKVTSGLKTYTISEEKHTGNFGENYVLTANGSGTDRFYVMALEDVDSNYHYWYYSASGNMTDYADTTSGDFGTGKQNTINMITKWKKESYGSQNGGTTSNPDLWGLIQDSSTCSYDIVTSTSDSGKWFVPSRAEWAAFAEELEITPSNYKNRGLKVHYWSSSQYMTKTAYRVYIQRRLH